MGEFLREMLFNMVVWAFLRVFFLALFLALTVLFFTGTCWWVPAAECWTPAGATLRTAWRIVVWFFT